MKYLCPRDLRRGEMEEYMKNTRLERAYSHSFENEEEILQSKVCGCFYCLRIFSPKEIDEFIDDKNGKTAICPYCGIDSVIGDNSDLQIKEDLLREMKDYWF